MVNVDDLVTIIKRKDYGKLKSFLMEHHTKMNRKFFSKLFAALEPVIEEQASPELVMILGNEMKHYEKTPDLYIYWLNVFCQILINVDFK